MTCDLTALLRGLPCAARGLLPRSNCIPPAAQRDAGRPVRLPAARRVSFHPATTPVKSAAIPGCQQFSVPGRWAPAICDPTSSRSFDFLHEFPGIEIFRGCRVSALALQRTGKGTFFDSTLSGRPQLTCRSVKKRRAARKGGRSPEGPHPIDRPDPLAAFSACCILAAAAISAFSASRLKLVPRCMGGNSRKVWISLAMEIPLSAAIAPQKNQDGTAKWRFRPESHHARSDVSRLPPIYFF